MPISPLFKQALAWGVGTQIGAQLVVGTINLAQATYKKRKKHSTS